MSIPGPDLLVVLEGEVAAALGLPRLLCEQWNLGLVAETGPWELFDTALDVLRVLAPQIRDEQLAGLVESLHAQLQRVPQLSQQVLTEIAASLHLPPPKEPRDYQKLARRRRKYDTVAPMWLWRPGFQRALDDMLGVCAAAERANRRIAARLALLAETPVAIRFPVQALVASASFAASHLHQRNSIAAVDITGRWQAITLEIVAEAHDLSLQIEDAELRELVEALSPPLRRMLELRDAALAEMARLGLPPLGGDGPQIDARLERYESAWTLWVQEPHVWQLYDQGLRAIRALEEVGRHIEARLGELQAGGTVSSTGSGPARSRMAWAELPVGSHSRTSQAIRPAGQSMRQIHLHGETLTISERDWDSVIAHVEGRLLGCARDLHNARYYGFPEILDESGPPLQQEVEELREVIAQVDDDDLRALLEALEVQATRVAGLNSRFVEVVARYLGLPVPQTEEERVQLTAKMSQYKLPQDEAMLNQPEFASSNPVWANQADYRELVRQSHVLLGEVQAINRRICDRRIALLQAIEREEQTPPEAEKRLGRLLGRDTPPDVAEDFGDQRAKDLIDMAGDVRDKRAVALLHRALRYGKTGIQAAKAYLGLARHYDDAGDPRRAIDYYTKAMEACREPYVDALYLRGKLYYRQEQWAEAADDLERALAGGLRSPALEWARMLLSRISARTGGEGEPPGAT